MRNQITNGKLEVNLKLCSTLTNEEEREKKIDKMISKF